MNDSSRQVALVTGANKGIGLEIARCLGQAGIRVLIGARNERLGREAAVKLQAENLDARYIKLDVNQPATVEAAATAIAGEFRRLDVLVNNAGILEPTDGPPGSADLSAVRRTMDTNFHGAVIVTQAMLPLIRQAPAGRIVNVSSGLGSLTWNGDPGWEYASVKLLGYNASKAALNMLTIQLAWELRSTPIKVNSANPGYTATDLNGHRGHQTVEQGAAEAVRLALLPPDGPTGGFFESAGSDPW
jgi:NAD(P)-dependent dehydrogenase (short-subunit alcohol dehydrogenase family)